MDAETEKKDSETTDPMLEQLMCQWRKDVEEFDAQVLVFTANIRSNSWINVLLSSINLI